MNRIFVKLLKKIKLNRICYKLLVYYWAHKRCALPSIPEAKDYISNCHPHKQTTFISENVIVDDPGFDLQIIVPAYNVENYIEECMDSILSQKTQYSYKVVVVNDGSTDCTRKLLKKYENSSKVVVIDQRNQGLAEARNAGMRKIDASYVMFVDSDDKLTPNAIQDLLSVAYKKDADIVQGGYTHFYGHKTLYTISFKNKRHSGLGLPGFAWGKVYKACLWKIICYPKGYWFEDINCFMLFALAKKMFTVNSLTYEYRRNNRSITNISKGAYRSIESFYAMHHLLVDMDKLRIAKPSWMLDAMIHQVWVTFDRVFSCKNAKLNKSLFCLTRNFLLSNFSSMECENEKHRMVYQLIKENNYKCFAYYCQLMW